MRTIAICALLSVLSAEAQQKRIYLAPDDHTDFLWTGDEEAYRRSFLRMLDYYLDLADQTKNEPKEYQSRWHADGSYWIWNYEKNKPPQDFQRLLSRIRDGHISFPLNALVSTYGGTPMEAALRGMYYSGTVERRFGIKIPMAIAMENQTLPYGLGALWAGSGAKYSWKGNCGCATKIPKYEQREHDIYWWKGDDGSRLLMKWNSLADRKYGDYGRMGGYLEARDPAKSIDFVDREASFKKAYPYSVIGVFGKGGDDLETLTAEFPKVAREKTTPARQVIVSNMVDFFEDFEKTYGKELPEFQGGFGNEWDTYTSSLSEVSAKLRRAVEKLRAAEAMASLVTLKWPEFMEGRKAAREQAFLNLGLYWEHDWTADTTRVSRRQRVEWGRRIVGEVESYVNKLHSDAALALGGMIPSGAAPTVTEDGSGTRFFVFNPLGWTRSSVVDIVYPSQTPVHVVDVSTGEEAPSQLVYLPSDTNSSLGQRYLRVLAGNLPAVGYKVFEVRAGEGKKFEPAAVVKGETIENARYRLRMSGNGAIRSLVDLAQQGREFAGGGLNDLGHGLGVVEVENAGPVSVTLRAKADGPLAHTTRVTLYRDSREIEIRNDIDQNFDGVHQWRFQFKLEKPRVWHEEVGAVILAKTKAEGGAYSQKMSRLDWLTMNHFADMSGEDGAGVTISNADLAFMKLGDSAIVDGVSKLDTATPRISVLAGGQIDGAGLGIQMQGGDTHFLQRFALRTHGGFAAPDAMRFSLEHQNRAVGGWVRGGKDFPETSYSMLKVSNPNVLLWALKPAEDGVANGLIARVWNMMDTPQEYRLELAGGAKEAFRATHIETDIEAVAVNEGRVAGKAARWQVQTTRLVAR